MKITIEIDTTQDLPGDAAVLAALSGGAPAPAAGTPAPAAAASTSGTKPAKKAAAAPAKAEPEPDLIGGTEHTVESAVTRATKLIADGEQAKVKAALVEVGAERVSTLELDQVPGFMEALDNS